MTRQEEYRARTPTGIADFIDKISGPLYSWRMAGGMDQDIENPDGSINAAQKSAETRKLRAQKRIEDLVVDYAVVVLKRRREQGQ